MKYEVELTEEQENFLDIYLYVHPLRSEHKREDYPGLIAHNFINSMMRRRGEFEKAYKDKQKESV